MVTRVPSRANICAISRPTAFPPITSMDSGSSVSSIAVAEVRYPARLRPSARRYPRRRPGGDQVMAGLDADGAAVAVADLQFGRTGDPANSAVPAMISHP